MTNSTDSFLDEVTEEVRRDRLYQNFRRYGWIGALAVIVIVGGAAWNEWSKAQERARAQALGDGILAALQAEVPADRLAALDALPADGAAAAVVALIAAAEQGREGDPAAAAAALRAIAGDGAVPQLYRDLALMKALIAEAGLTPPAERISQLELLAVPGAPFRLLAQEQIALAQLEAGDTAAAAALIATILEDAGTGPGLRTRAENLQQALGLPASEAAE